MDAPFELELPIEPPASKLGIPPGAGDVLLGLAELDDLDPHHPGFGVDHDQDRFRKGPHPVAVEVGRAPLLAGAGCPVGVGEGRGDLDPRELPR